ncbi:MAG: redoxin family protein, partial [Pseudomonadales bacterium]
MKKLLVFLTLFLFVLVAGFFFYALEVRKERPVSELASALIDRPFPEFELPTLEGQMISRDALVNGEVTLVNVWGSWCIACRAEHPYLKELAESGVRIVGINYKDPRESAIQWLNRYG